ncbi:transmembrane protein, putative [Medicago truncatula]|uniref:Transmembrane protein, putative n=1 Tax=Medicago truncatula TaxID=3880 RepID=A0A072TL20_MEDTR|nr:transmembrane protein, putative [Medicago truncatula]
MKVEEDVDDGFMKIFATIKIPVNVVSFLFMFGKMMPVLIFVEKMVTLYCRDSLRFISSIGIVLDTLHKVVSH